MSKEVMTFKVEPDLKEQFQAVAASMHKPASQIIRELMRAYIASSYSNNEPNSLTAETLRRSRQNDDVFTVKNAGDLFRQLEI